MNTKGMIEAAKLFEEQRKSVPELATGYYVFNSQIYFYGPRTYREACALIRKFGAKRWTKSVTGESSNTIEAIFDHIHVQIAFNGLPPTCHIEKYTEKIPKTMTTTTNEFVEVERTRVVCSGQPKV